MPCYFPITGYRSKYINENGKRPIVFDIKNGFSDMKVQIPCGQCLGCRLEYSRQWAIRCVLESKMFETNSFLTLTYRTEDLPEDWSVSKRELQLFLKRLRKKLGRRVRYFACGEYGETCFHCGKHITEHKDADHDYCPVIGRPHYHLIIFGYDFPDKVLWSVKNGNNLYRSAELESVWQKGMAIIGNVTFDSCAYVARYILKKQKGKDAPKYYERLVNETGEILKLEKEFCIMSTGSGKKSDKGTPFFGGIGLSWYEKFKCDTDKDFITIRGVKVPIPKYFDTLLERRNKDELERKKGRRRAKAKKNLSDNTSERLRVKQHVKEAQIGFLNRDKEF